MLRRRNDPDTSEYPDHDLTAPDHTATRGHSNARVARRREVAAVRRARYRYDTPSATVGLSITPSRSYKGLGPAHPRARFICTNPSRIEDVNRGRGGGRATNGPIPVRIDARHARSVSNAPRSRVRDLRQSVPFLIWACVLCLSFVCFFLFLLAIGRAHPSRTLVPPRMRGDSDRNNSFGCFGDPGSTPSRQYSISSEMGVVTMAKAGRRRAVTGSPTIVVRLGPSRCISTPVSLNHSCSC